MASLALLQMLHGMLNAIIDSAISAGPLALIAFGLALFYRTSGILPLEMIVAATCFAMLPIAFLGSPGTYQHAAFLRLLLVGIVVAAVAAGLVPVYRKFRIYRGGEAATLIISFALMSAAIVVSSLWVGSRALPVAAQLATLGLAPNGPLVTTSVLVGTFSWIAVAIWAERSGFGVMARLTRDDGAFLKSLGRDPKFVLLISYLVALVFCVIGTFLYMIRQDRFSIQSLNTYLLLVFALAFVSRGLSIGPILIVSLVVMTGGAVLNLLLPPQLDLLYQGVILILVVFAGVAGLKFPRNPKLLISRAVTGRGGGG